MSASRLLAGIAAVALAAAAALPPTTGTLSAQAVGRVEGTVVIAGRGEGFPGVRISIPALGREEITDLEGRFAFPSIPEGAHEIRTEAVGCRSATWTVEVLGDAAFALDLMVDGSAFTPGGAGAGAAAASVRQEAPYTVERLGREDLHHDPARTIADLIRGAFPGVKVVQGSGAPGARISIQLRGPTSISGAQDPLVVVDGIITGGGLDDIDPRDIESLEILKGSAGAAIYGSRGQAGVIEITTGSGRPTAPAACYFVSAPSM